MTASVSKGKSLILGVIFSSFVFLFLHSTELPFQEYGNIYLLTLFRVIIFVPLLIFLYLGFNWARLTLTFIFSILIVGGILGVLLVGVDWLTTQNSIFIAIMLLCAIFNSVVLFYS